MTIPLANGWPTCIAQLSAQLSNRSAETRQLLKRVAAELAAPDFLHYRLQLLVTSLDHSSLATELVALHQAVANDPLAALTAADLLQTRLTTTEPAGSPPISCNPRPSSWQPPTSPQAS